MNYISHICGPIYSSNIDQICLFQKGTFLVEMKTTKMHKYFRQFGGATHSRGKRSRQWAMSSRKGGTIRKKKFIKYLSQFLHKKYYYALNTVFFHLIVSHHSCVEFHPINSALFNRLFFCFDGVNAVGHNKCYEHFLLPYREGVMGNWIRVRITEVSKFYMRSVLCDNIDDRNKLTLTDWSAKQLDNCQPIGVFRPSDTIKVFTTSTEKSPIGVIVLSIPLVIGMIFWYIYGI
uniref:DNA helicase n=1 Tax=Angiostrongylus cantonensis TaxID=6313 RepID=A0A0K0DHC4_ANGCA